MFKLFFLNAFRWEFSSQEELNGQPMTGMISTYGGGGYTVLLGENLDESSQVADDLKVKIIEFFLFSFKDSYVFNFLMLSFLKLEKSLA